MSQLDYFDLMLALPILEVSVNKPPPVGKLGSKVPPRDIPDNRLNPMPDSLLIHPIILAQEVSIKVIGVEKIG